MDNIIFRGWSKSKKGWVYGWLFKETYYFIREITNHPLGNLNHAIEPDSIGIYINKDDKNGKKIFCGCNGAKYGSDIIRHTFYEKGADTFYEKGADTFPDGLVLYDDEYMHFGIKWGVDNDIRMKIPFDTHEVISSQWTEHLNEKHSN